MSHRLNSKTFIVPAGSTYPLPPLREIQKLNTTGQSDRLLLSMRVAADRIGALERENATLVAQLAERESFYRAAVRSAKVWPWIALGAVEVALTIHYIIL